MPIYPKNKSSKNHRDQRKANWKMGVMSLARYPKCGEFMMPHRVCKSCGTYNKKKIVKVAD